MDIKIKPVEIKIKDNKKYCEIAYLVDQKQFLEIVCSARKLFRIKLPIPSRREYPKKWLHHLTNDIPNSKELISIKRGLNNISPSGEKLFEAFVNKRKDKQISFFKVLFFVKTLIKKRFELTHNYLKVIENAIVFNRIGDKTYYSVFGYIFDPLWLNPAFQKRLTKEIKNNLPNETGLMLFFTPQANKTELKKAINSYYDQLIKDYYQHFHIQQKEIETISNIKRDRRWYWLHQKGKSYRQIVEMDTSKENVDPIYLKEIIRKAVKQYEKALVKAET